MFKQPFYKYSFIVLLIIDVCYTLGLIAAGVSQFSLDTWYASAIWFVTFYWLPIWLAASIVFKLRHANVQYSALEWFIVITCMSLGNIVTDNLLHNLYNMPRMGFFVIFNGTLWGSVIYFAARYWESRQKIVTEKSSRKQAQLETLRYQLNPHFMFNSLNTISAYIHNKPDLADEVLHELADILRYSLDTAEKERVPLKQELTIIEKYLNIEKARFGDKLNVRFSIAEELNTIDIPPLLIQPIIENAIKHNAKQANLEIALSIKSNDQNIVINVQDNGKGFTAEVLALGHGKGIGMKNLQQRIKQLEGGVMTISNSPGANVCLEMAL